MRSLIQKLILTCIMIVGGAMIALPQTKATAIRNDYMTRQLDNTAAIVQDRLLYADTLIHHALVTGDMKTADKLLRKKAEIANDYSYYKDALEAYNKWLGLQSTGQITPDTQKVLIKMARLYYYFGWYSPAINLLLELIQQPKTANNSYLDLIAYEQLANCFMRLRDMKQAEKYSLAADSCMRTAPPADSLTNKSINFNLNLLKASLALRKMDYASVDDYLKKAYHYASGTRDTIAILNNEAIMYEMIEQPQFSRNCYETIINYRDTSYQSLVGINNYVYFLTWRKEYNKAHQICKLSYSMLEHMKLDHALSNLMELEAEVYFQEKDYLNAYSLLNKSKEISDTLFSSENMRAIATTDNLAELYSLRKSLSSADRTRTYLYIFISITLIIIIALGIALWRLRYIRKYESERDLKENEKLKLLNEELKETEKRLRHEIERQDKEMQDYRVTLEDLGKIVTTADEIEISETGTTSDTRQLLKLMDSIKKRYQDWNPLRSRIESVRATLNTNLQIKHPDITKAELAVAACILLDISTKDIAAMQS
ncbi:MAG: hypothetical protein K2H47_10825, partial [Muribaculaceae bacterium]|nr:hypothetical protein [Muribaculaceae bacterium]